MTKKRTKYLAVFATTTLIFVFGIILGNYISEAKLEKVDSLEQELKVDTIAMELQYSLISENPCSLSEEDFLSEELYTLGSKLDYMENSLGIDDPKVKSLKGFYSLLEIRHWMLLNKIKEECGKNYSTILYFYSNDCKDCEEQGYVLTYLREKDPKYKIYSFDVATDNAAINTIKDIYLKDPELPALVIDEDTYYGFMNKKEVQHIVENTS